MSKPDTTEPCPRLAFEVTMNGKRLFGQNLLLDQAGNASGAWNVAAAMLSAWHPVLAAAIAKELKNVR